MQSNDEWSNLNKALDLFEPHFKIKRDQGRQVHREPLNAFVELGTSFTPGAVSEAATDVKKPL